MQKDQHHPDPLSFTAITSFSQSSVEFIPSAGYTFASRSNFMTAMAGSDGGLNLGVPSGST